MLRRLLVPDKVAVTGCVTGLFSLAYGWLTLKPNRLVSGVSMPLWNSFGLIPAIIIIGLWVCCFGLSLTSKSKHNVIVLGIILNLIVILAFLFAGTFSSNILRGLPVVSRVSLGTGIWLTCLGAYISIFACRQKLTNSPVWQNLVSWPALAAIFTFFGSGLLNDISVVVEFRTQEAQFIHQLWNHILLFAGSVALGTLIGIPLGIFAAHNRHVEKPVFFIVNIVQTIPSLALFGLLIAPLSALSFSFPLLRQWGISGIGTAPAIIALVLYSLLPVTRNTYVSLKQIDPAIIDSGSGMGMTRSQIFKMIEAPLSAPLVLEGVRTASVQAVGNTAVAALIGAGGLGWFIFQGISQASNDVVILGAIPIVGLALIVDAVMRGIVKVATPKGIGAA
jgi:osmoprotectant transport system permease protein